MLILAQMDGVSSGAWVGIVSTIANTGFAALVGWYLLTKALPKMQDTYLGSQERQQKEYLESQKSMREQYGTSAKEQREQFLSALDRHQLAFQSSVELYRKWFDERETRTQSESKTALHEVIKHCEREAARRDESMKMEMSLVNDALRDLREVLEDLRGTIRDYNPHGKGRVDK